MTSSNEKCICLLGDYSAEVIAHVAIPKALDIAFAKLKISNIQYEWLNTRDIQDDIALQFKRYTSVWCVPASPYENMQGVMQVIRYVRENKIPFLGTCGGYQHAIIEFARNVLNLADAANGEVDPDADVQLIIPLGCALIEESEPLAVAQQSRLAEIYGAVEIYEKYHCSYGFNAEYYPLFERSAMKFTVQNSAHEFRAFELEEHPFFFGTAFQPERTGLQGESHPLILEFVKALTL